jgi:dTDP-4-dehydrorhamnose reductase
VRILITGASGFVGSHLGVRLTGEHEVLGLVFRSKKLLPFSHRQVDLTSGKPVRLLIESFKPNVIVHCAACSKIVECEDHPDLAADLNIEATTGLVREAERLHAKVIFLSTDQVFSGDKGGYRESDATGPLGRYGLTKLEGEQIVLRSSARALVIRSNSVVGRSFGFGESFSDMVVRRLGSGQSIVLFEDQYRSPIHIRSMVEILHAACVTELSGLLHAGGPKRMSRLQIGYALARSCGLSPDLIEPGSYRNHPRANIMTHDTSYDTSRLRQILSLIKQRSLDEEFLQDVHEAGVRA